MNKKNIKLLIEYDGTNYCGWQRQTDDPSIQEALEEAIFEVTGENVTVTGSGRTDSRVHALGQVANFHTSSKIPADKFRMVLNGVLERDIVVKDSKEVDFNFHACDHAKGKEYKYIIYNGKIRSAIKRNYSYFINQELNLEDMEYALKFFIGRHDFRGFMATGSSIKGTVRTITDAYLVKNEDMIEITIKGTGFLYNMVRIIAGTLIDVGRGKIDKFDIEKIIESRDRIKAGHTADAKGLYLSKVFY